MPRLPVLVFLSLSAGVALAQVPDAAKAPADMGKVESAAKPAEPKPAPVAAKPAEPKPAPLPPDGDKGKFTPTPVVPTAPATGDRGKWLKEQIDAALADPELAKAKVGVDVVDIDSGKTLYARNDAGLFN